jgi:hypothetical protein
MDNSLNKQTLNSKIFKGLEEGVKDIDSDSHPYN